MKAIVVAVPRPAVPVLETWVAPSIAEREIIALADSIESYSFVLRLHGVAREQPNGGKAFVVDSRSGIRTKILGPNLSKAQRDILPRILLVDLNSRTPVERSIPCPFVTTHGLRFWRGAEFVDATFNLSCNDARIGSGSGPIDAVADRLRVIFGDLEVEKWHD